MRSGGRRGPYSTWSRRHLLLLAIPLGSTSPSFSLLLVLPLLLSIVRALLPPFLSDFVPSARRLMIAATRDGVLVTVG